MLPPLPNPRSPWQIHTSKMATNSFLGRDVDLAELAARTKNFSGAEIEGLVKSATSFALNRQVGVAVRDGRRCLHRKAGKWKDLAAGQWALCTTAAHLLAAQHTYLRLSTVSPAAADLTDGGRHSRPLPLLQVDVSDLTKPIEEEEIKVGVEALVTCRHIDQGQQRSATCASLRALVTVRRRCLALPLVCPAAVPVAALSPHTCLL